MRPLRDWARHHHLAWWIVVAVLSVTVAYTVAQVVGLRDRAEEAGVLAAARGEMIADMAGRIDMLRDQVIELGEVPEVPRPRITEEIAGPEGPRGVPGPRGPRGLRGPVGAQGDPGPGGPPGEPGDSGPVGDRGPAGARGSTGPTGEAGQQGPAGEPGSQGPQGERGPRGATGETGRRGATGEMGPRGPVGADGQPPVSWTIEGPGSQTFICIREPDFDPDNPHYECTRN